MIYEINDFIELVNRKDTQNKYIECSINEISTLDAIRSKNKIAFFIS